MFTCNPYSAPKHTHPIPKNSHPPPNSNYGEFAAINRTSKKHLPPPPPSRPTTHRSAFAFANRSIIPSTNLYVAGQYSIFCLYICI